MIEQHIAPAWVASFREWFGLTRSEAKLLLALYHAEGAVLSEHNLSQLAGVTDYSVRTHLSRVRAAMQPEALDHERREGYRLTQIGMDECRAAITDMATELKA